MNEGASACAGGIAGACDELLTPDYQSPGALILLALLVVLVSGMLLLRKKVSRKMKIAAACFWMIAAIIFATVVYVNTETAGERSARTLRDCEKAGWSYCEF